MKSSLGLVQVYIGEQKGKTTAALGLGLRAVGHGFSVYMISFLKGGLFTGELAAAERLYPLFRIVQFGRGCPDASLIRAGLMHCRPGCRTCFIHRSHISEHDRETQRLAFDHAREVIGEARANIVILDEVLNALRYGLVDLAELVSTITGRPEGMELILTGRTAPPEILELADLATEMKQIKHPISQGIRSRRGIEY